MCVTGHKHVSYFRGVFIFSLVSSSNLEKSSRSEPKMRVVSKIPVSINAIWEVGCPRGTNGEIKARNLGRGGSYNRTTS